MNLNVSNNQAEARFLRACQRLPVDSTPVWFMRQAGRYLPEYRAIREKFSLLEIVARPELAAEVTLQPVDILGVDAAILFADILLPIVPMGMQLEFAPGEGPIIRNPIRSQQQVAKLRNLQVCDDLGHVLETIRIARRELAGRAALIGFAGAPFTIAAYMIEGGASRNFAATKTMMYAQPETWSGLMEKITASIIDYLLAQFEAGVQAVQLFDSWVGALSPLDYERFVVPYSQTILKKLESVGKPVIHFGTGTATLLKLMRKAGGTVIGLDWRVPLDDGREILGSEVAVQGNLDPVALVAPLPVLRSYVDDILQRAGDQPGHIFNLGHGILPQTPVENVRAVVDMVHEWTGNRNRVQSPEASRIP